MCKCILQAEKCISPTHQLTYLGFHAYVESAFEIKIVPITKIEPLTKQEHRWRESKRIPEKMTIFIVAPLMYAEQMWLLTTGHPKNHLPLFQIAAKH